jgi:hypothetical protein
MFGKPILGLVPRDGASAELLRKLGDDVVAPDDVSSIVRSIEGLLSQWQTGNLKHAAPFEDVASSYHPERVGLQWEQALSRASESVLTQSWWQSMWMR